MVSAPRCPPGARGLLALLLLVLLPGARGNCGAPPRLTSAELQDEFKTQTDFAVGTTVRYSCRSGYQRVPGVPPTLTCERDSVWSEPKEFCQRRSCGHPGDLVNGKVQITDLLFGSSITFSCDEGFRLIGQKTSQCVIDGTRVTWNHEIPFCEEIPCRPPPEIENGRYTGDPNNHYTYGSTVTYSCNTGGTERFSLIGAASIHCTADEDQNGIWSGEPPECKVVKCSDEEVENGRKESGFGPSYTYQDAITFGCDAGYFLVGSKVIICQANNSWSPAKPRCERAIPCRPPPDITNGSHTGQSEQQFLYGSAVTYKCDQGFSLIGEASIHCTTKDNVTGEWSGPAPECKGITPTTPTTSPPGGTKDTSGSTAKPTEKTTENAPGSTAKPTEETTKNTPGSNTGTMIAIGKMPIILAVLITNLFIRQ